MDKDLLKKLALALMRLVFAFFFLILFDLTLCQEKCFPFKIGNGLSFINEDSILVSKPIDKLDKYGKSVYRIFLHTRIGNGWSEPIEVPFSKGNFTDYHPEAYGDSIVFFISRRPESESKQGVEYGNLWYVKFSGAEWTKPEFLYELNYPGHDTYPSFTKSGNLYFNSDRPGGKGSMDIYVSKYENGAFKPPVPVTRLNTEHSENDLVVEPMERFIIFNRYSFSTKELDLFISFKENDTWNNPTPLTSLNRSNTFELTPTLSLDNTIVYYEINGAIFCIKLDQIVDD